MVLRASGQAINLDIHLEAIVDPSHESGVPSGKALLDFADALLGIHSDDHDQFRHRLHAAREALAQSLPPAAVAGASLVVGAFTKNDRIANGIGIPMDGPFLEQSKDFRDRLGLTQYRSAQNTIEASN